MSTSGPLCIVVKIIAGLRKFTKKDKSPNGKYSYALTNLFKKHRKISLSLQIIEINKKVETFGTKYFSHKIASISHLFLDSLEAIYGEVLWYRYFFV